jgi:hypothetical protein
MNVFRINDSMHYAVGQICSRAEKLMNRGAD